MKILYLFPKKLWDTKMSHGRRSYAHGMSQACNLKVWGDGWDGYDNSLSLQKNIDRSGFEPDALWLYKPESLIGLRECRIPKFCCYNECWWPDQKAKKEVESYGASLVICHHENDMQQFEGFEGRVEHIPHAAPEAFFCDTPHDLREIQCLSSGVQSKEIYPMRHRLKTLVESKVIPGVVRKHPGYRLASVKECDFQTFNYASALGNSKISLCCSSKYEYLLAKVAESAMAGCLVVTDEPSDSSFEPLRPHVIVVQQGDSDKKIANRINDALESGTEEMAIAAQEIVKDQFSMEKYCQSILAYVEGMA